MLFAAVNHVAIIVSNLEVSLGLYRDIFGFEELKRIDRPERKSTIVYLQGPGGVIMELFTFPDSPKRASFPEALGLRHVAFTTEQFDEVVGVLEEKGFPNDGIRLDERTGKRMTFIQDPDGLPIEICENSESS
jgi:glyoxylase I family protein